MDLVSRAERWIADDPDPSTQEELRELLRQPDLAATDLADRFAATLEFGTAGLRGVLGAGPNRMNRAVVARATWAVARELLASVPRATDRAVVVGGDARRMSHAMCDDVAAILCGAGLRVLLWSAPVPTPLVGFLVKRLGCAAGVVVTASHNPAEYNGYKVYWENGAQIVPPVDARIAAAIERAPAARQVPRPAHAELRARGLLADVPEEAVREYLGAIQALAVRPGEGDRALPIVYTPLHGVGNAIARRAFAGAGFTNVTSVPEQEEPDPTFSTVPFPNPEEPGAMDRSIALAKRLGAELVVANDPDADRLAAAVTRPRASSAREAASATPAFVQLTGNQLGVLLGHYLLTERAEPRAPRPRAVLASIVSSPLLGRIAGDLGVHYEETLTGFKWIANRAIELEREGYEFVFGYEEALGYCVGSAVRDKDGISAALVIAELAAVLRAQGATLLDRLAAIAERWGLHASSQASIVRKGAAGVAALREAVEALRLAPPASVGGDEVVAIADYVGRTRRDVRTGVVAPIALPSSLVVALELASGSRIIARPSGTEPKAKVYFDARETVAPGEPVAEASARAAATLRRLEEAFADAVRL
jgi:phosphomannomutase